MRPSPARAVPYDPDAWLPVPDPSGLPEIESLLLDARVTPSPARAAPHDPDAWLPLPDDLSSLPSVEVLLAPPPELGAAVVAEAEQLVRQAAAAAEAVVAPSPARAAPHDPTAWLPVPDPDRLVVLPELEPGASVVREPARRRLATLVPSLRAVLLVVFVAGTVAAGFRVAGGDGDRARAAVPADAFAVTVDLDGAVSTVHTTERSARRLMRTLGVGKGVALRNVPGRLRAGSEVVLRTRRTGTLFVDGMRLPYNSPSRTVEELLETYLVVLTGDDYVVPGPGERLVDGQVVEVVRVGAETKHYTEPIPFDVERVPVPTIAIGESKLVRAGVPGELTVTYRERVVNGKVQEVTVLSKVVTREPVSQRDGYGTKADWHWDELARCESNNRWGTIDHDPNGFHGGLGIAQSTWIAFGGREFAPNAGLATREEQIVVGQRIYAKHGWYAWGCARNVLRWPPR